MTTGFVERLAAARIGGTFNQYADSELRRGRLERYLHERRGAPAPNRGTDGEPGERAGRAVPVALGAHSPLPDGGGAHAPRGRRVRVRSEHGDFGRREPPMAEGYIRREAGEPGADDCAPFRHGYLTEPASRPCTK